MRHRLTPQRLAVLRVISAGARNGRAIAVQAGTSPGNISTLLLTLEQAGYCERTTARPRRQGVPLRMRLTAAGWAALGLTPQVKAGGAA